MSAPPTPTAVSEASTANFVYLVSKEHSWIPAKVVEQSDQGDQVTVKIPVYKSEREIVSDGGKHALRFRKETVSLKDYPNQALPLQNVDEHGKLLAVEDMVDLAFLHEVRYDRTIVATCSFSCLVSHVFEKCMVSNLSHFFNFCNSFVHSFSHRRPFFTT